MENSSKYPSTYISVIFKASAGSEKDYVIICKPHPTHLKKKMFEVAQYLVS